MSKQIRTPAAGDSVALMKTTMGDIKILFFPEAAPKAVENFISLSESGYYNGIIFHRVIPDFMIQGGDPTGTGMGGESKWGRSFEDEFNPSYHNLRGALSMANAGPGTNGSQFFIVQADSCSVDMLSQMKDLPDYFPADSVEDYANLGGTPWLDYHHTVFGQVIDGMDVVDAIASAERDSRDKPYNDIKIESIEISKL